MNTPNTELERIVDSKFDGSNIFWNVIAKHLTTETLDFIRGELEDTAQTYAKQEVEKALLAEKDNRETDRPINNERE